jgi:hypothetical protein
VGATDSSGVPWAGRSLPDPGFAGDAGAADPRLEAALASYDACATRAGDPPSSYDQAAHVAAHGEVLDALAGARLLVPVVAVLDEAAEGAGGLVAEKSTDMALVTLQAPDGAPAVPAFTALDRLRRWRDDARPVPAEARRVALSAVGEGCTRLVVDPAGPVTYVVERAALWALARGQRWRPPHEDPEVLEALSAALAPVPEVLRADLAAAPPTGLRLVLALRGGLDEVGVDRVLAQVGGRLAERPVVAERVDGLALSVVAADAHPGG